jgi:hypothetical protein
MCLAKVFTKKEREEILAKLPEEFTIWKVLNDWGKDHEDEYGEEYRYTTDCRYEPVHAGEMRFVTNTIKDSGYDISYRGGGHFWLHKEGADEWANGDFDKVVRCKVRKKWITNMGIQNAWVAIVVKKAVFPKYIGQMRVKNI